MSSFIRNIQRRAIKALKAIDNPKVKRKKLYDEQPTKLWDRTPVMANLGKNHPDYGLSPKHHFLNKKERENG